MRTRKVKECVDMNRIEMIEGLDMEVSPIHIEALSEIANLGTGHAVSALSDMLQRRIDMDVPSVEILPVEEAIEMIGSNQLVVGVFLQINGDIPNNFLAMIPRESAMALLDFLMDRELGTTKIFSSIDESALMEVGNILACSYSNALSEFMAVSLIPEPPQMAFDMATAVMEYVMLHFEEENETAMIFHCEAGEKQRKLQIHLMMIPPIESLKKILERIDIIMST
jgi:chemotaxis protein CheC